MCRFNTQPPEGGWLGADGQIRSLDMFQHTAARRRLVEQSSYAVVRAGFNTQPPEGGWVNHGKKWNISDVSTHSRPKAAGVFR